MVADVSMSQCDSDVGLGAALGSDEPSQGFSGTGERGDVWEGDVK